MRIRQIVGLPFVTRETRTKFEGASFYDLRNAIFALQQHFPNHLVFAERDRLVVSNKDRSIRVGEIRFSVEHRAPF